jgi:HEAT repeat protein
MAPCLGGADVETYAALSTSPALSDRYTAVRALGRFPDTIATGVLFERMQDDREHIYVRVEAAAGLMRRGDSRSKEFLAATLYDDYVEHRLEAAIVLGEVATLGAAEQLKATLQDTAQDPEIRAGAAWALGEVGNREALPTLIESFNALEIVIKVEAARALARIGRRYVGDILERLPDSNLEERPGIAWAVSRAGGFTIDQLLPALVDEDARQWVAFVIGTQPDEAMLPQIEALAARDPQVYFAVTVLWKIIASWVYGLEEY